MDGGQLRFQLYIWLEKEVEVLKTICNYGSDGVAVAVATGAAGENLSCWVDVLCFCDLEMLSVRKRNLILLLHIKQNL